VQQSRHQILAFSKEDATYCYWIRKG
jgi:TusA-related sulfurtransferase